ncbi:DUF4393 domain-containing protein [Limosilactobacillus reuteri]|uniref:DUF4393 domain-containing protein n=1 Tax=Limosilactobacillus reuteri TaxID=1598 RepID=UPI000512CB3E|nr:DUF4393 domain-containing protein [Limosilactobacillus reuteri]KGE71070.1 hypothetical protein HN00_02660 [Limosilactobacillus reuteri]
MDTNQLEVWKNFLPDSTLEFLLNPLAKDVGYCVAGLFYSVFKPLVKRGIKSQAEVDKLIEESVRNINEIAPDKLTTVNRGIAYKVMEDARFSISSEELRNMFAKLIADSFNDDAIDNLSPYFSTVISNLTVNDARFLRTIYNQKNQQLVYGYRRMILDDDSGVTVTHRLYMLDSKEFKDNFDVSVDTLKSLGILNDMEKDELTAWDYRKRYQEIAVALKTNPVFFKQEFANSKVNVTTSDIINGHVMLSELGQKFCKCIFENV